MSQLREYKYAWLTMRSTLKECARLGANELLIKDILKIMNEIDKDCKLCPDYKPREESK